MDGKEFFHIRKLNLRLLVIKNKERDENVDTFENEILDFIFNLVYYRSFNIPLWGMVGNNEIRNVKR